MEAFYHCATKLLIRARRLAGIIRRDFSLLLGSLDYINVWREDAAGIFTPHINSFLYIFRFMCYILEYK